ncbi:hypothetical protein ABH922_001261 [Rhodococcus sp. 27YEA15]|uniref:hypothetical protein n=1 Tax=Rhodococcus sp. 27YEA15 TaxID=3156259 RepID=UPI003C7C41A1
MSADPWSVEVVDGKYRLTNITGAKAAMITIQGLGTRYNEAVPHPIENGAYFDLTPGAGVSTYRLFWVTIDPPKRQYEWDYTPSAS